MYQKLSLTLLITTSTFFSPKSFAQMPASNTETPQIIYVYDALCGWCYGFSSVMDQLYKKYNNGLDFEVISGGLVTDDRIGPIGEVAPYIQDAYKDVEETTGVTFGPEFLRKLEEGSMIFTSLPAAVAMTVFKMYQPEKSVEYASALQNAIYFEGMPPAPYDGYAILASTFGIDEDSFLKQMNNPMIQQEAYAEFTIAYDMGVTGFPAVFLRNGNDLYKVSAGYTDFSTISGKIDALLAKIKEQPAPERWYDEN
jgi:putative protein-disulfide isomerase